MLRSYGVPDHLDNPYPTWFGELFANQGFVAVSYEADSLYDDFENVVQFLDNHERALRLDLNRLAVWAASEHGRFAGSILTHPQIAERLRAVAFFNGDPEPVKLSPSHIAFFLCYPRSGSRWDTMMRAFHIRLNDAGNPVIAYTDGPGKNMFGPENMADESAEILDHLFRFLRERLDMPKTD